MTDIPSAEPAAATVGRALLEATIRKLLTVIGTAAVTRGMLDQGTVDGVMGTAVELTVGIVALTASSIWSFAVAWLGRTRFADAWAALRAGGQASGQVRTVSPTPAEDPHVNAAVGGARFPESTMSLKTTLLHALGAIAGILIPGASPKTTDLTHNVQQELADLYGEAAGKMAAALKLDTTGMSGPEKIFAINKALVETAVRDGFKGDVKILADVTLDIAQAAYRKVVDNIDSEIVALATSLTTNPLVLVAAELVGHAAQAAADQHQPTALAA